MSSVGLFIYNGVVFTRRVHFASKKRAKAVPLLFGMQNFPANFPHDTNNILDINSQNFKNWAIFRNFHLTLSTFWVTRHQHHQNHLTILQLLDITMNPTKQTILHDPANGLHGNCLSGVIASLLHLDIATVPNFTTPETWVKDLNAWLRPFGLAYCMIQDFDCHIEAYGIQGLYHEISGSTVRSKDVTHACVAKDGEFLFDPHPDNTGLTKITCHGFFIALRPWEFAKS